ncbi:MAG: hypothetical protein MUO82_07265 [Candidatus Thermoplasmatota archaeon]|nr:hypothetical protein [Candidatus Thermoplasmatota archaeon]
MIENSNLSLDEYRMLKSNLHRELTNCCKKYQNKLGIVSMIGIIEIIKQEVLELQKVSKEVVDEERQVSSQNQRY